MTEKQDTNMPETIMIGQREDGGLDLVGHGHHGRWPFAYEYTRTSAIKEIERKAYNRALEDADKAIAAIPIMCDGSLVESAKLRFKIDACRSVLAMIK